MNDYFNIPTELLEIDQWVNWTCVTRDQKTMKLPIDPKTGSTASPTDHETWGSFIRARKRSDKLGFVITEDDVYVGIDIDNCVKNGVIHEKTMHAIQRFNSYTEFSPSGTGIHIFVKGKIAHGIRKANGERRIEIYGSARYFTMTGDHVEGTPTTIEYRQDELDAVISKLSPRKEKAPEKTFNVQRPDEKVLELAMNSKSGEKFRGLWSGDLSMHSNDHSKADFALISMLWYWTNGNEQQVDRMFRHSGLMRDKWDEYRGAMTYGEITIERVKENNQ